jgi:hypothetical protein
MKDISNITKEQFTLPVPYIRDNLIHMKSITKNDLAFFFRGAGYEVTEDAIECEAIDDLGVYSVRVKGFTARIWVVAKFYRKKYVVIENDVPTIMNTVSNEYEHLEVDQVMRSKDKKTIVIRIE